MKSTKSLSIEDTNYLRGIVDYNGSFNVARHTRKTINTFMARRMDIKYRLDGRIYEWCI